jgi:AraC-like DNA-binding protein
MNGYELILENRHFHDLNPILFGYEKCEPLHRYGPASRRYVLLHYVESGRGKFYRGGKEYSVEQGHVFRILPGEITTYEADENDPWVYRWLGFDGALAERFSELDPVFSVSEGAARLFEVENSASSACRVAANLFLLYEKLFESDMGGDYVRRVRNSLRATYMHSVSIASLARQIGLDRRYLTRIFHERTGESIQNCLIRIRMEAAKEYLLRGYGVGETAERCGYSDPFLFSKMFKRRVGISPREWKKRSEEQK